MKKILFYKLDNTHQSQLSSSFYKNMNVSHLQPYMPSYTKFFTYYNNNSYQSYIPRSKEIVYSLLNKKEIDESDNYIKHVFESKLISKQKCDTYSVKDVFVKTIPMLDPIEYCKNQYRKSNHFLPNIFSWMTQKKINDTNNAAYVENLASYILSNITERNECPSFPYYYGGFIGTINSYKYDATQEWDDLLEAPWFKQACNSNKVSIEMKENQQYTDFMEDSFIHHNVSDEEQGSLQLDELEELLETLDLNTTENKNEEENENRNDEVMSNEVMSDVEELESDFELEYCNSEEESLNDNLEKYRWIKWLCFKEFPVVLCCMEKMEYTLEELYENNTPCETEWKSILFQICFALAIAYRKYKFIHNDFHSCNIMFVSTNQEYLYYKVKNEKFKIPTYGKLVKIIDFNRAIYSIGKHQFFSDVFKNNGDAEGQYDYPYNKHEGIRPPNPSFDLARLATTIYEYFPRNSEIFNMCKKWTTDNYGNCLLEEEDSFDLYIKLSQNIKNARPEEQLYESIFDLFRIENTTQVNEKVYTLY